MIGELEKDKRKKFNCQGFQWPRSLREVYRSMIDMIQNDVHTFKEWCDENGFEDVFHDKFNSQHFEMAMIAFHEARAGVCKPKEERMQVGEIEETLAGPK